MAVFACLLWVFYPLTFTLLCTIVSARPLSIPQPYDANSSISTPEPLITTCLVSFLVLLALLAVKLIYMKHRRLSTIRSPNIQSTSPHDVSLNSRSSLLSVKVAQLKAFRSKCTPSLAIFVGCLGSPAWETDIESDIDMNSTRQRRTALFMYQLHRQSKQRSSKSYSAAHRSSKSSTSQAPPSQAQLTRTRSTSFFSFSSEHSTENTTKKLRSHPLPNIRVLTYPTKARSRKTATVAPQRYSLFVDSSISGQLGDFCEKCDTSRSSLRARNFCYPSDRTTSGVDIGPSLRLVGTSDVTAVPYSFLSAFPPSSFVLSPLTGTRDSLQLPRRHSKSTRKPIPPLPPLPSYSLFSQRPSCISPAELPASLPPSASVPHLLPLLEFSPPASMYSFSAVTEQAPAYLSKDIPLSPNNSSKFETCSLISPNAPDSVATVKLLPHVLHPEDPLVFAVQKMKRKTKHRRSSAIRSRSGIVAGASPLRIMALPEDMTDRKPVGDTPTSDKENHVTATSASKAINDGQIYSMTDASNRLFPFLGPPSSLDAQPELLPLNRPADRASSARSVKSTKSLARSDIEGSLSDLSSLQTPKSDRLDEVDIGMLGLDRFHWSEESEELLKSCSSHIKNDSVALISFWEEGQWMRENNQCSDIGTAC